LSDFPELLKPSEVTERDEKIESLKEELAENTRYYVARLNEAGATIGTFKDKLEALQAKKQRLQNDLGNSQAEVIELRLQLEKERASREEIEAERFSLKQNFASAATLSEKLTPDAVKILVVAQLREDLCYHRNSPIFQIIQKQAN
jgi:chromosome segregation ATPase